MAAAGIVRPSQATGQHTTATVKSATIVMALHQAVCIHAPKMIQIDPQKGVFLPRSPKRACSITSAQKHFKEQQKVGIALYLIFFPKYFYLIPGLHFIHQVLHSLRGPETHCLTQPQHTHDLSIAPTSYRELTHLLLDLSSSNNLVKIT